MSLLMLNFNNLRMIKMNCSLQKNVIWIVALVSILFQSDDQNALHGLLNDEKNRQENQGR